MRPEAGHAVPKSAKPTPTPSSQPWSAASIPSSAAKHPAYAQAEKDEFRAITFDACNPKDFKIVRSVIEQAAGVRLGYSEEEKGGLRIWVLSSSEYGQRKAACTYILYRLAKDSFPFELLSNALLCKTLPVPRYVETHALAARIFKDNAVLLKAKEVGVLVDLTFLHEERLIYLMAVDDSRRKAMQRWLQAEAEDLCGTLAIDFVADRPSGYPDLHFSDDDDSSMSSAPSSPRHTGSSGQGFPPAIEEAESEWPSLGSSVTTTGGIAVAEQATLLEEERLRRRAATDLKIDEDESPPSSTRWAAGAKVLAKYSEMSHTWKPATVEQAERDGSVVVTFDGYSDETRLPIQRIKDYIIELPPIAIGSIESVKYTTLDPAAKEWNFTAPAPVAFDGGYGSDTETVKADCEYINAPAVAEHAGLNSLMEWATNYALEMRAAPAARAVFDAPCTGDYKQLAEIWDCADVKNKPVENIPVDIKAEASSKGFFDKVKEIKDGLKISAAAPKDVLAEANQQMGLPTVGPLPQQADELMKALGIV